MKTSFVLSKYWANKFVNLSRPISLAFNFNRRIVFRGLGSSRGPSRLRLKRLVSSSPSSNMAANFWLSSHCNQWLLDREEIELERQRDYQYLKGDEYKKIHIFFVNFIQALGEHLKLRQQVIATATLYYKRFYARNSLKSIDSLLMAPTCTYLAHKTEECGVISNNRFTAACNAVVKNKFSFAFPGEQFPYRMTQVGIIVFNLTFSTACRCLVCEKETQ